MNEVISVKKLMPCPFCGSTMLREVNLGNSIDHDDHYIACNDCNCQGVIGKTLLHARKKWNTRAITKGDRIDNRCINTICPWNHKDRCKIITLCPGVLR